MGEYLKQENTGEAPLQKKSKKSNLMLTVATVLVLLEVAVFAFFLSKEVMRNDKLIRENKLLKQKLFLTNGKYGDKMAQVGKQGHPLKGGKHDGIKKAPWMALVGKPEAGHPSPIVDGKPKPPPHRHLHHLRTSTTKPRVSLSPRMKPHPEHEPLPGGMMSDPEYGRPHGNPKDEHLAPRPLHHGKHPYHPHIKPKYTTTKKPVTSTSALLDFGGLGDWFRGRFGGLFGGTDD